MALKILADSCANCGLCMELCPVAAIQPPSPIEGRLTFRTDPERCTECVGHFGWPRCVRFCRMEAIVQDWEHVEDRSALLRKWHRLTHEARYSQELPYGLDPVPELGEPVA